MILFNDINSFIEFVETRKRFSKKVSLENMEYFVSLFDHPEKKLLVRPFPKKFLSQIIDEVFKRYQITETSRMLDNLKDLGFKYSTIAGITVSAFDVVVAQEKDEIIAKAEETVKKYMPSSSKKLMTAEEADILSEYMTETVENGTASKLKNDLYTVAGKTGTAEYSSDKSKSHAWFVGFSNVENPDLVVCVIVEESGAGSEYAVPVAKKIFDTYYKNK